MLIECCNQSYFNVIDNNCVVASFYKPEGCDTFYINLINCPLGKIDEVIKTVKTYLASIGLGDYLYA